MDGKIFSNVLQRITNVFDEHLREFDEEHVKHISWLDQQIEKRMQKLEKQRGGSSMSKKPLAAAATLNVSSLKGHNRVPEVPTFSGEEQDDTVSVPSIETIREELQEWNVTKLRNELKKFGVPKLYKLRKKDLVHQLSELKHQYAVEEAQASVEVSDEPIEIDVDDAESVEEESTSASKPDNPVSVELESTRHTISLVTDPESVDSPTLDDSGNSISAAAKNADQPVDIDEMETNEEEFSPAGAADVRSEEIQEVSQEHENQKPEGMESSPDVQTEEIVVVESSQQQTQTQETVELEPAQQVEMNEAENSIQAESQVTLEPELSEQLATQETLEPELSEQLETQESLEPEFSEQLETQETLEPGPSQEQTQTQETAELQPTQVTEPLEEGETQETVTPVSPVVIQSTGLAQVGGETQCSTQETVFTESSPTASHQSDDSSRMSVEHNDVCKAVELSENNIKNITVGVAHESSNHGNQTMTEKADAVESNAAHQTLGADDASTSKGSLAKETNYSSLHKDVPLQNDQNETEDAVVQALEIRKTDKPHTIGNNHAASEYDMINTATEPDEALERVSSELSHETTMELEAKRNMQHGAGEDARYSEQGTDAQIQNTLVDENSVVTSIANLEISKEPEQQSDAKMNSTVAAAHQDHGGSTGLKAVPLSVDSKMAVDPAKPVPPPKPVHVISHVHDSPPRTVVSQSVSHSKNQTPEPEIVIEFSTAPVAKQIIGNLATSSTTPMDTNSRSTIRTGEAFRTLSNLKSMTAPPSSNSGRLLASPPKLGPRTVDVQASKKFGITKSSETNESDEHASVKLHLQRAADQRRKQQEAADRAIEEAKKNRMEVRRQAEEIRDRARQRVRSGNVTNSSTTSSGGPGNGQSTTVRLGNLANKVASISGKIVDKEDRERIIQDRLIRHNNNNASKTATTQQHTKADVITVTDVTSKALNAGLAVDVPPQPKVSPESQHSTITTTSQEQSSSKSIDVTLSTGQISLGKNVVQQSNTTPDVVAPSNIMKGTSFVAELEASRRPQIMPVSKPTPQVDSLQRAKLVKQKQEQQALERKKRLDQLRAQQQALQQKQQEQKKQQAERARKREILRLKQGQKIETPNKPNQTANVSGTVAPPKPPPRPQDSVPVNGSNTAETYAGFGGSGSAAQKKADAAVLTPHQPKKESAKKSTQQQQQMPPKADSDDGFSSDSSDVGIGIQSSNKKVISSWAKGTALKQAIYKQFVENVVDPDTIFGPIQELDLEQIFSNPRNRRVKRARGSSAHWHRDGLTTEEIATYRKEMGFASPSSASGDDMDTIYRFHMTR